MPILNGESGPGPEACGSHAVIRIPNKDYPVLNLGRFTLPEVAPLCDCINCQTSAYTFPTHEKLREQFPFFHLGSINLRVQCSNNGNPEVQKWHQDGEPISVYQGLIAMWSNWSPTEIKVKDRYYQPEPEELVMIHNPSVHHKRPREWEVSRMRIFFRVWDCSGLDIFDVDKRLNLNWVTHL